VSGVNGTATDVDSEVAAKLRDAKRKRAERARAKLATGAFDPADRPRLESVVREYEQLLADESAASASAVQTQSPTSAAGIAGTEPAAPAQEVPAPSADGTPDASPPKGLLASVSPDKSARALVAMVDHVLPQIFGPVMKTTEEEQADLAEKLAPVLAEMDMATLTPAEALGICALGIYGPRALQVFLEYRARRAQDGAPQ